MAQDLSEHSWIDFGDPTERRQALRIGRAWVELRRGAHTSQLREFLYGNENRLEQGQMDALDLLVGRDRTMSGLAERLHIDPSTATRAVQRLEAHGLAERFPSPEDGRVVMVRISELGRVRHADVADRRTHVMRQILGAFRPDERSQLADLLDRFVESVDDVASALAVEQQDRSG